MSKVWWRKEAGHLRKLMRRVMGKEERNTKNFIGFEGQGLHTEITLKKMGRRLCQMNIEINFLLKKKIHCHFLGREHHSAFFGLNEISKLTQLSKPQGRTKGESVSVCFCFSCFYEMWDESLSSHWTPCTLVVCIIILTFIEAISKSMKLKAWKMVRHTTNIWERCFELDKVITLSIFPLMANSSVKLMKDKLFTENSIHFGPFRPCRETAKTFK